MVNLNLNMNSNTRDFYIGLLLAVSSSIFIGSSFILKKKGLLKLSYRAGSGGFGYLKEWMWWAGLILMATGEAANFVAYAFAPATLVTPLGALSVLFSAFLASKWLNEKLNILGKVGCLICLLGSMFVVLHSPKEQEVNSFTEIQFRLADPGFISYTAIVLILSIILIFLIGPRYGATNPLVYVTVTGTIGSLSVMGCKGLGVGIKEIIEGNTHNLGNWLLWVLLICVAAFITVQMIYLNKALDLFNTAIVTPMLYVVFTGCVILASGILYKEWSTLKAEDIVGNLCGFVTIIVGIFLLQAFKDHNISLPNFGSMLFKRESNIEQQQQQQQRYSFPSNYYKNGLFNGNLKSKLMSSSSCEDGSLAGLTNEIDSWKHPDKNNLAYSNYEDNDDGGDDDDDERRLMLGRGQTRNKNGNNNNNNNKNNNSNNSSSNNKNNSNLSHSYDTHNQHHHHHMRTGSYS